MEFAIQSANAIGFTSPEKYTLGTSAQRVKWFNLDLQTGDLPTLKKMFEMPYDKL